MGTRVVIAGEEPSSLVFSLETEAVEVWARVNGVCAIVVKLTVTAPTIESTASLYGHMYR